MKRSVFFRAFFIGVSVCLSFSAASAQNSKIVAAKTTLPTPKPVTKTSTVVPTKTIPVQTAPAFVMPATQQGILEEINVARTNPAVYIGYLQEYRKRFKGNEYNPADGGIPITTNEGVGAVDDAIAALKALAKRNRYGASKGLAQSADFQLGGLKENPSIGHRSADGGDLSSRLARFGSVGSIYAENITYYAKTPQEVVREMLIDDGIKSRSHRKNVLSDSFKIIGVGFGAGKGGQTLCVVVFADSFIDKGDKGARQF